MATGVDCCPGLDGSLPPGHQTTQPHPTPWLRMSAPGSRNLTDQPQRGAVVHFHHGHDDDPCEQDHDWPDYVHALLATLNRMESTVTEAQSHLDAAVQSIADGLSAIEAEIANLKQQPQAAAVDFSALDSLVSRVQGDVPAPAPAPAAPVDGSGQPATDPAPVDGSAPAADPNAPIQPSV